MRRLPSGCPNHVTAYYMMIQSEGEGVLAEKLDKAIDRLQEEAGQAWLDTNFILLCHGWIRTLYSSVKLWSIRTKLATSS